MRRREFLDTLALGSLILATQGCQAISRQKKLQVLVLGGTYFVGPAIVQAALDHNFEVTLFNRGITNPDLFPTLPHIEGDRETGIRAYEPLREREWDVIIDVWPEKSHLVDDATQALANVGKHYMFISSIAVYRDFQQVGLHEESPVVSLETDDWYYSEEKLAAELLVKERFPEHHTILRPGPIKGWRDPALDLLYWCLRLKNYESIIAPGSGKDPLQFIDVRDVGRFAAAAIENRWYGTYNCTGPQSDPLLWDQFLQQAAQHFSSNAELHWAPEEFLSQHQVASFSDLPLWAPLSEDRGFMQISNEKLVSTGFEFTPLSETLTDCVHWYDKHIGTEPAWGTSEAGLGLDRSREAELIAQLRAEN
jgi:2'-hydroxyisoflavone reductase